EQLELTELFDDRDDVLADLCRENDGLDKLIILEPVADDRRLVVIDDSDHREQLRLAAGFKAEFGWLAEGVNLLHDVPLLVHLDRIDAAIVSAEFVLADRVGEGLVDLADAMLKNV